MVDILPLGSGSVDPHIIADPDPKQFDKNKYVLNIVYVEIC